MKVVLDVNARVVRKKNYRSSCCNDISSTKKVHEEILVLVYIRRTICFSQYHGRDDGWVNL
jgi:hypothetical protein